MAKRLQRTARVRTVDLVPVQADLAAEELLTNFVKVEIKLKKNGRNKNKQKKRTTGAESASIGTMTKQHLEKSNHPRRAKQEQSHLQSRIATGMTMERQLVTVSETVALKLEGHRLVANLPRRATHTWSCWASLLGCSRLKRTLRKLTESWQCDGILTGRTTAKRRQKPQRSSKLLRTHMITSWRSIRSVDMLYKFPKEFADEAYRTKHQDLLPQ